jgi:iron complex transport system substrate-binding protein
VSRVVSLTPSATEVVAALGATNLLVGVDQYSTYPPEVAALPKVGSFLAPNLEAIAALKPDLVIVDDVHDRAATALHDIGIETIECPVHSIADVEAALTSVGTRIGRANDAAFAIRAMESALDDAREHRPARRPRVLAVIDREAGGLGNLVAAGPGSYIDELLAVVGAENVLAASGTRYPKIAVEEILRVKPDLILDLSFATKDGLDAWTAVPGVPVAALPQPYLQAPSPRIGLALAAVGAAVANH